MPGMSGLQLMERLNLRGSRIPVIILTAYEDGISRQRANTLGAAAYFKKPVDDDVLIDGVRRVTIKSSPPDSGTGRSENK